MNLLIINGSPREGSSTEILAEHFADSFTAKLPETAVVKVRLNDMDIVPCQSCGFSPAPLPCVYKDDLYSTLLALREADFILVASPIYFDSVSSLTKLFIDRCNCIRPPVFEDGSMSFDKSNLLKAKGAYILVGGERQRFDTAERVIGGMFVWCGVNKIGRLLYAHSSSDLGAVESDDAALAEAGALGAKAALEVADR